MNVPVTDYPRCIDCRWFDPAGWSTCGHPKLGLSQMNGLIYRQPVEFMRMDSEKCGREGKWHELKPRSPYATPDDSILRAHSRLMEVK